MVGVELYVKGQRRVGKQKLSTNDRFGLIRPTAGSFLLICFTIIGILQVGCQQLRLPKIDANGKGIFVNGDSTQITRPFKDTEKVRDLPTIIPKPAFQVPDAGSQSSVGLSNEASQDNEKPKVTPGMIWVSPKVMAAPIGSAVVLKAGIVGSKRQLLSGRKLEWTVAEGSTGVIESAGGGNPNTFRWLFPKYGNQASETYAHTITAERNEVVHQDTVDYFDDIGVAKGEAWTVVSSDRKGTTELLVGASTETNWDKQYQKILVHWIDAQWQFPNSVSGDAGSDQVLTTVVSRPSDNSPLMGWIVRYKLVSNRRATLSSQESNEQLDTIDVTTDVDGKAAIRVSPNINQAGIVYVTTEVIRPADVSLQTPALVVGESTAAVTWDSPGLSISSSSPKIVELGKTMDCLVTISNPGNQTATNVALAQTIPPGLSLDASNPVANLTGNQALWNLGDLAPQTQKQLTIRFVTGQQGAVNLSFLANCDEGLQADSESLTNILIAPLEITVEGPRLAKLGDDLQFQILLHNSSNTPISNLSLLETLGPGLIHISKSNPLGNPTVRKLAFQSRTIEPNSTTVKAISMRATRAGTVCHTLQATLPNGLVLEKEVCIEISAPIQPDTTTPPVIEAKILSDQQEPPWEAGKPSTRRFQISNQSTQPITNVMIKATLPPQLQAQLASEGHRSEGQSIILDIPTLLPGQTRTLVIQILAAQQGSDLSLQMEVTGDAIAKIVKTSPTTIVSNADENPLDLSPPPMLQSELEVEPSFPDEPATPNLNPADTPEAPETASNTIDEDTFPLKERPNTPADKTPEEPIESTDAVTPENQPIDLQPPETTNGSSKADDRPSENAPTPSGDLEFPPAKPLPLETKPTIPEGEEKIEDKIDGAIAGGISKNDSMNVDTIEPNETQPDTLESSSSSPELLTKTLSLNNPIAVGDENIFFVYLSNNGTLDAANININMEVSEHLDIVSLAQKGTDESVFTNTVKPDNRKIDIPVLKQLAKDMSIVPFQVKVKAVKEGQGKITVSIAADSLAKPVTTQQIVRIIQAR